MTFVVTGRCDGCKFTDCVAVCPVDCFYEGTTMLYINPDECIDCQACVDECPVDAIFDKPNVPEDYLDFIEINKKESTSGQCPNIVKKKTPLNVAKKKTPFGTPLKKKTPFGTPLKKKKKKKLS